MIFFPEFLFPLPIKTLPILMIVSKDYENFFYIHFHMESVLTFGDKLVDAGMKVGCPRARMCNSDY